MNPDFVTIGEVVSTQGHRGELRVLPLTDFPERFRELREVFLERGGRRQAAHVERVAYHGRFVIFSLREVPDMNAAEQLRGALLQVPLDQAVALPEGRWYIFEIVGLRVYTTDGESLGIVVDVLQTGANDVYVVHNTTGREVLIPALKDVVREIDSGSGRMVVSLPDGLME